MFSKIQAKNFRSFKNVSISSLKRVNVFTGMNGCGKTSVLEIPFLLAGGPNATLALSLYNFRNEHALTPNLERPFTSVFHELSISENIELDGYGDFLSETESPYRKLVISPIYSPEGEPNGTKTEGRIQGLTFDFQGPNGEFTGKIAWETETEAVDADSRPRMRTGLRSHSPQTQDNISAYFITPYYRELWGQAHNLLTELTKKNRVNEIVRQLKMIEPNIQNLLPLSESGVQTIYADIGAENLMPVPLLGGGFANIFHMVLDASVQHNGLLIIDEIEDGIHYIIVPKLIRYLLDISVQNNLQLFISTHSDEMLDMFAEVANDMAFEDLALFRLLNKNGEGTASYFSFQDLLASRETNAELR
ncbi:MAG TPA: AAA family ATPase [Desulfatiglandales bacterium]|nr:AAA family ATPase [Desulfatiglandales bacterium]